MVKAGRVLSLAPVMALVASTSAALAENTSAPAQDDRSGPAVASAEASPPSPAIDVTLYGWLAGSAGELTPFTGAPTLEFDNSFGEVLADLDAAFFASIHARAGKLVLFGDLSYASLSRDGLVPPGIPAEGEVSQFSLTAAAGARVIDNPGLAVDVLAGARLWVVDGAVEVPLAGVSVAPGKTFVDPIIGARAVAQIAPRFSILLHGDLGGVGIGSDFTYQLVGTLNYRVGQSFFISAGYRHLGLDYTDGGTIFEGSMTGPVIGLTKRF